MIMILENFPMFIGQEQVINEMQLLTKVENGYFIRSKQSISFLVLHCSDTRCDTDYPPSQMLLDHKARGFRTIGYHFYVRKDGTVTQHRKINEVGAHCRPYNRCSIGICYEGGRNEQGEPADTRTQQQTEALTHLFKQLLKEFPYALIMGHRDMRGSTPKECPCLDTRAVFGYLDLF